MKKTQELETSSIASLLLKFSIPAIVGTVTTSLYNVVDRIFLGQYIGQDAIAATTVAFPLMMIMMAFGMLIGYGTTSQISIKLGEKKYEDAEKLLGQGIFLFVAFSIFFTLGSLYFLKPLLYLFGSTETIYPYASEYLSIVLIGTLAHEISFGVNSFIRGEGSPRIAMVTMLVGGLVNIVLDYIFIAKMGWGMKGAAWATVIGYSISAIWVIYYYLSGKSIVKLKLKNIGFDFTSTKRVALMGSPSFAMNIIASLQMTIFNNQLAKYGGESAISIMGIIMSFNMIWLMPIIGLTQGLQPIVGYNHGAKRPDRVKKALFMAMGIATFFCCCIFALLMLYPDKVFAMFVSKDNVKFIADGADAIQKFLLLLPIIGCMITVGNFFQFTGRPKISLKLTVFRQAICQIPSVLILPIFFGLQGIWYGGAISDGGALIATIIYFSYELKRLNKQIALMEAENKEISPQIN